VPRLTLIGEGVGVEAPKIHNLVKFVVFHPTGTLHTDQLEIWHERAQ